MTNMTLKQWRAIVRWPWRKRAYFQRIERHRLIIELSMITVTALASFATVYSSFYSYKQYNSSVEQLRISRDQLNSADRNKTIQLLFDNMLSYCAMIGKVGEDAINFFEENKRNSLPRLNESQAIGDLNSAIGRVRPALLTLRMWLSEEKINVLDVIGVNIEQVHDNIRRQAAKPTDEGIVWIFEVDRKCQGLTMAAIRDLLY